MAACCTAGDLLARPIRTGNKRPGLMLISFLWAEVAFFAFFARLRAFPAAQSRTESKVIFRSRGTEIFPFL